MPSKRKNSNAAQKVAKDLDKDLTSGRSSKRTRNNRILIEESEDEVSHEKEQVVVVKIKTSKKFSSTIIAETKETVATAAAPLSAIAARRAAKAAGLYQEPEVEEEEEHVEEEDEEYINREGIDVASITDEEDIERREALEMEEVVPVSGTTTPNGGSTPMTPSTPLISAKNKNKIPHLMDHESVSNFVPVKGNCCVINQEDDTYIFIGLKKGEDIVFMGQVLAAPLYGAMSVSGAVISSGRQVPRALVPDEDLLVSLYPIFSPRTHSLLRISSESMDTPAIQTHYNPVEIDENLIEAVFDELKVGTQEFESVIVIKDLEGESHLEDMSNAVSSFTKNLVKLTKKEDERDENIDINYLPGFHPILKTTPGVKAFKIESSWSSRTDLALANAKERPVVSVVCGAKDMGKSSYSRYLINRLLSKYKRVAYIETDVGQSEFTPSGLLSLHYLTQPILGPPYTHQQIQPERSFFFGSASPRNNPDYYLECINELVDHWKRDQAAVLDEENDESEWIPLVVNTQGWVSGVGYNLLVSQIQKIEPTDVFTMRHHIFEYKNLPHTFNHDILPVINEAFMMAREPPQLHYLDCVLQDTNVVTLMDSFTSIQQRDITLGSFFHQSGAMNAESYLLPKWNFKQHMIERAPWVIDWRQSLNAVWIVFEEVKMNELFYALNGSLVGLIGDVIDFKKQNGPKHVVNTSSDVFVSICIFLFRSDLHC
ncbi:unnamed protein product [Mucor hiemalis]